MVSARLLGAKCFFSIKERSKFGLENLRVVYHGKTVHNYFMPCHRKYSGHHNQCDIHAAHTGKVTCNTVQYIRALLYFN